MFDQCLGRVLSISSPPFSLLGGVFSRLFHQHRRRVNGARVRDQRVVNHWQTRVYIKQMPTLLPLLYLLSFT